MQPTAQQPSPGVNPFRGLIPYEGTDQLFARDADVQLVQGRFWTSKVTVLFAGSGVGKTSFLNAKLLPALRASLGQNYVFVPDRWTRQGDPTETVQQQLDAIAKNRPTRTGNVLVLDQFEETFQYLTDPKELTAFGKALASIAAEDSPYQTRLLIAIREEFLANLTGFDLFVPGILTNYYRLEKVTADQAKLIVEKTVEGKKKWNPTRLSQLIADLFKTSSSSDGELTKDNASPKASSTTDGNHTQRDAFAKASEKAEWRLEHVDLPYLQIVCRRIWDRESEQEGNATFLSSYKAGDASGELRSYCREHLSGFHRNQPPLAKAIAYLKGWKDRYLLARAVAHLTGPHEAKKAVKVTDLAFEMNEKDPQPLERILQRLSDERVRIIRSTPRTEKGAGGPRQVTVYELYHDMYSPMLWKWREEQLAERQGIKIGAVVALTLCVSLIAALGLKVVYASPWLEAPVGTKREVVDLLDMRNWFARTMVLRPIGDHLWREYTIKLANKSALREDTDGALLYALADPAVANDKAAFEETNALLGPARFLEGTYSVPDDEDGNIADAVLIRDKGTDRSKDTIMAAMENGHIVTWTRNGERLRPASTALEQTNTPQVAVHTLCLSPDGKYSVVASASPSKFGTSEVEVSLKLVLTSGGETVSSTVDVPIKTILKLFAFTAAAPGQGSSNADPAASLVNSGTWGAFNPDGARFAVAVADQLYVFHTGLFKTESQEQATPVHLDLNFATVEDLVFVADPAPAANYDLLLVAKRSFQGQSGIQLFDLKKGIQEVADNRIKQLSLPPGARCVVGSRGMLLYKDREWVWVRPDTLQSDKSRLDKFFLPQAFDEDRQLLVSTAYLNSPFVISEWHKDKDQFESEALSITTPRSNDRKLLSIATSSQLGNSKLLTVERRQVRLWNLETLKVTEPIVKDDNPSCSVDKPQECLCSIDRQVCLTADAATQRLRVARNGVSESGFAWEIAAPSNRPPVRAVFNKDRTRVVIWFQDRAFYASKAGRVSTPQPLNQIVDAEFGPGSDLLTVVTNDKIELRDLNSSSMAVPVSETCIRCRLLHTSDDKGVVVYGNTWIHRIKPDSRNSIHRKLESDTMWPIIVSEERTTPIRQVRAGKDDDSSQVLIDGAPFSFLDIERRDSYRRAIGFLPHKIDFCPLPEKAKDGPGLSGAMCEWERRSGRHLGSPPPP